MATLKRRQPTRIYTAEDVAVHNRSDDLWVIHEGKVYDLTLFAGDHPGGDDLILRYAGKDLEGIMSDRSEHEHSTAAFGLLADHCIGRIGTSYTTVSDAVVITDDFEPEDTDVTSDFAKTQFLDLSQPLMKQVWAANWSKRFYLEQVHQPRHVVVPARLFGSPFLEMFTRTPWYVIPIIWVPISAACLLKSIQQFCLPIAPPEIGGAGWGYDASRAYMATAGSFAFGCFFWTFIEYFMHRFLFHLDEWLPDNHLALTVHFLLHGVHHYLPMDHLRLVMPPLLFFVLEWPFTRLAYYLFPSAVANGVISGAFAFYVLYDMMHYAMHHTRLPTYLGEMKKYHLAHHYKNFELGFGVTSKFWDYVFGSQLEV